MKRVTETDIRVLRSRAGRTPKPKSKTGMDGMVQLTGSKFVVTKESLDILTYAGQCSAAFVPYCAQADRCVEYENGNQWGDMIEVKNKFGCVERITEEEWIKRQGRPAFKQNLVTPIVRRIIGEFRSSPYKSVVYSSDEGGQGAADQMSVKVNDVLRYNDSVERDVRAYRKFLVTGSAIYYIGYAYDQKLRQPMPFFEELDYHRYFQNPDASDVAGKDVRFCGDFVDIGLDVAKSIYAHNPEQEQAIEEIFASAQLVMPTFYNAFVEENPASKTFLGDMGNGMCRIIRVCRQEGVWDLTVHDYADASYETYSLREFPHKEEEILAEIAKRRKIAESIGMDYEDPATMLKIVYEKKYNLRWMYYHLSPWGHILWQAENPYQHNSHCYVTLFHPLLQGRVRSLVYDLLDQQRLVNRMIIDLVFAMGSSSQGQLIVDEDSIPDDMDIEDIAESYEKYRGVIKLKLKDGAQVPIQLNGHQVNVGQFEMVQLMMRMMMDISGVQGAMKGEAPTAGTPASLYAQEVSNSETSVRDYSESFAWFLEQRDYKLIQIIQQFMGDSYSPAPEGASEAAKHYNAAEVRKYKLYNQIQRSMDTGVVRLFNQQLMANLLMGGAKPVEEYLATQKTPFSEDLLGKLQQAQSQLQSGQGVSQQQIAGIQAALPQSSPDAMAAAMQFANR